MSLNAALADYLQTSKEPRDRVAAAIGRSTSTLSQYLHGKYPGNTDKIDTQVAKFLKTSKARLADIQTKPEIKFCMTAGAKKVFSVLATCHLDADMGKIIAAPGRGKTKACKAYAIQNKRVLFITALETYSINILLKTLVDKLGINPSQNNAAREHAVIQILKKSGRMIIIDEAHKLTPKCLEVLREIHDGAGIGLVYAGGEKLRTKIDGHDMEQVASRIGISTTLPALSEADYRLICEESGIAISKSGIKKAAEINIGSGRLLEKNLTHAIRRANGREITADDYLAADRIREIA